MKFMIIAFAGVIGFGVGLAACNNNPEPAAPSMKAVDSATAAAPDTIKAIPVDSVNR